MSNHHLLKIGLAAVMVAGVLKASEAWAQTSADVETAVSKPEASTQPPQIRRMIDELEVRDMDVNDVLKILVEKSGLNIVSGQDVTGQVTIYLKDVDVYDALRIILDANGLAYNKEDGIIHVMTAKEFLDKYGYPFGQKVQTKIIPLLHADAEDLTDILNQMKSPEGKIVFNENTTTFILIDAPEKIKSMETFIKKMDVPIETETIELKHVKVESIARRVQNILTKDVGHVRFDSSDNKIVVTDTVSKISEIREMLQKLDTAEKYVGIQAKVIQIILNDEHIDGVDWEAIVSNYQGVEFLGLKNAIEPGEGGKISMGTVSAEDYEVLIEALDTVGDVHDVSDVHKESDVNAGTQIIARAIEKVNLSEENGKTEEIQMGNRDEDVKLFLTPRMNPEEVIDMYIEPEVFSLAEKATSVKVESGSTIVIGGLFKMVDIEQKWRIPLISDIPLIGDIPFDDIPIIGFAFRNQGQRVRRSEIIIFLTPTIQIKEQ